MDQNDGALQPEPADKKNRLLETALDDLLRRVPSLSGETLEQAKQEFLRTVARSNSEPSSGTAEKRMDPVQ